MPPLTREQLVGRRAARRRRPLRRDPRALVSAAIPVVVVALLAILIGVLGNGAASDAAGPLASPVPSPDLGSGARPPERTIARGEGVEVHLPVDPQRVTALAFHAIDDPSGVALDASGSITIHQSDRRDRVGPDTAGLDVGAPAGTAVYSPVDGVIASVSDYMVSGKIEGYEVTITPDVASSGLVVRVGHLADRSTGARPSVGRAVRAGITPLGAVQDFSEVADQELSRFTSDSGNHVELELVRARAALIL